MGPDHPKRSRYKLIFLIFLLFLTLLASLLTAYFLNINSYLFVPGTLSSLFLIGLLCSSYFTNKTKIIAVNCTVLIAIILLSELSFFVGARMASPIQQMGTYLYHYFVPDTTLGYKIYPKDKIYTSIKKHNEQLVYDVRYHINAQGFRITPEFKPHQACIWFVGDSFTFGEGVNDNESLPYLWAQHKKINALNFGIHGYGPHQVLRFLEITQQNNSDQNKINCLPNYVFFQVLPTDHLFRALGQNNWDKNGPWYDLDSTGHLYFKGKFSDKSNKPQNIYLQKSYIVKYIESKLSRPPQIIPRDWAIYKAIYQNILTQTQALHAQLIVFLWDIDASKNSPAYLTETKQMLDSLNIRYVLASSLLDSKTEGYFIKGDGHPTAKAYEVISANLYL